jgi:hypothetical protein
MRTANFHYAPADHSTSIDHLPVNCTKRAGLFFVTMLCSSAADSRHHHGDLFGCDGIESQHGRAIIRLGR